MINHVRTILLNEHNSVAGPATGLPYAEYIDPVFVPFNVPTTLRPMSMALYSPGMSIAEKLVQTRGILTLIHLPLFEQYILYFDKRITYSLTDDISNTIEFDTQNLISRINRSFVNPNVTSVLFHNPTHDQYLDMMYQLWSNGQSAVFRVNAAILTYVYKCEQLRVK